MGSVVSKPIGLHLSPPDQYDPKGAYYFVYADTPIMSPVPAETALKSGLPLMTIEEIQRLHR